MKKFMKGCAITALILIALGIVLAVTAQAVRGTTMISQAVESVTGGRFHVNLGSLVTGNWGIYWDDGFRTYDLDDSIVFDKNHDIVDGATMMRSDYSFEAGQVKSLDIEVGGCSFETKVSENEYFYLDVSGIRKVQCYTENGVLHIKAANSRVSLNTHLGSITLYVPEGHSYDQVDIEFGAGELLISDLAADEVSLDLGAGHVKVKGVQAQEISASVGMGQLEFYDMDVALLDAEVGMGELVARGNIREKASLECAMGNMQLTLTGSERDFNYHLEAAAGNIDLGRNSYSGLAREQKIDNGASKNLDVECSMGNISIQFTE